MVSKNKQMSHKKKRTSDDTAVASTSIVAEALIIAPHADKSVAASRDERHAIRSDIESCDGIVLAAVENADRGTVDHVPVGNFTVGAGCEELGLVGMVEHSLELSGGEEADITGVTLERPNDARTIIGGRNALGVVCGELEEVDLGLVLLHRCEHAGGVAVHVPDADLAAFTTGNDASTIESDGESSDTISVGVVDHEERLAGLRTECTDFTVIPSGKDRFSVAGESHAETLEIGHANAKQLGPCRHGPHADLALGASDEQVGVAIGESDIVDGRGVAGGAQLVSKGLELAEIHGALLGADEEVVHGSVEGQRGDAAALHLCLVHDFERVGTEDRDDTITGTRDNISVTCEQKRGDTEGEGTLLGTALLEEFALESDLEHIARLGTAVHVLILPVDHHGGERTLQLTETAVSGSQLPRVSIQRPHTKVILTSSHELIICVIEKADNGCCFGGGRCTADGLTSLNIP